MPNAPMSPSDALLSICEVAELLACCEKTVWNRCCPRGDLPCVRIGSRLLFRRSDIDSWVESRTVRAE